MAAIFDGFPRLDGGNYFSGCFYFSFKIAYRAGEKKLYLADSFDNFCARLFAFASGNWFGYYRLIAEAFAAGANIYP